MADQLQTNYASDLRHILKAVFECNTSDSAEKQTTSATLQEFPLDRANDASEELDDSYEGTQPSMVNNRVSASQEPGVGQPDSSDSSGKYKQYSNSEDSDRTGIMGFWLTVAMDEFLLVESSYHQVLV